MDSGAFTKGLSEVLAALRASTYADLASSLERNCILRSSARISAVLLAAAARVFNAASKIACC